MAERLPSARRLLRWGEARLARTGIGPALQEAEWLLGHVTNRTRIQLYLDDGFITRAFIQAYGRLVNRRYHGEPLQYLTGETEFFGRRFRVEPGVFIPRPETESILAAVLDQLRRSGRAAQALRVVEGGTGSGCMAVTLACELPACQVVATDVSYLALTVARSNAQAHGVERRVFFVQGRWNEPLRVRADVCVSNPPYIPSDEVNRLPRDVQHEPRASLDGGADGTRDLLQLLREGPERLVAGGILALECGEEQVAVLQEEAQAIAAFDAIQPVHDLAGRPRGLVLLRGNREKA